MRPQPLQLRAAATEEPQAGGAGARSRDAIACLTTGPAAVGMLAWRKRAVVVAVVHMSP